MPRCFKPLSIRSYVPACGRGRSWSWTNLSAHKIASVRQSIETAGASLLYLPPYSPDLNPIEKCWSKIKQMLRSLKARTAEALQAAMTLALASISPQNARAWFQFCGYTKN
jgi:transposase